MFAQYAFPTTAARAIELGDVEASSFTGSRRFRRTAVGTGGARQSVSPNLGKAYALFSSSRSFVTSRSFWKNRFDKGRKARRFCRGPAFVCQAITSVDVGASRRWPAVDQSITGFDFLARN